MPMNKLSRGKELNKEELQEFINNLPILNDDKERLLNLEPSNYIGLCNEIVKNN